MTTLADISLKVIRQVTDVLNGAATAGAATSITDSVNLTQNNQYWDKGTLWVTSGAHDGKVLQVTGHVGNKLSFASLGATPIGAGDRFSVCRFSYPWLQIMSAVQQALDETHVTEEDDTLIGDGETLEFSLPAGVYNIKRVEYEREGATHRFPSHHWHERPTTIRWDYGYFPEDGDIIHIFYRTDHPELTVYTTEISNEINLDWLKWKAAEKLLIWGAAQYGKNPEYLIEERMNIVLNNLKGKSPRRDGPDIILKTAGA